MNGSATAGIIERYELIARMTAQMRAAAQAGCWDQLLGIEAGCRSIFEQLVAEEETAQVAHPPGVLERKAELIRQILADDAVIRRLVEPRLADIEQWLGGTQRSRLLHGAYAAGSAA